MRVSRFTSGIFSALHVRAAKRRDDREKQPEGRDRAQPFDLAGRVFQVIEVLKGQGTSNMASIDVNGTLQVDKCNAKIVDTSGKYACPSTDIGEYTFTVTNTTLAYTVVSDPCDGRRIPLTRGR